MTLRVRFLQLPIIVDAERLAAEATAIPQSAWREHPQKFPGNDALTRITTGGDLDSDTRSCAMAPTPPEKARLKSVQGSPANSQGRRRAWSLAGRDKLQNFAIAPGHRGR
jgi:hypothetical protein